MEDCFSHGIKTIKKVTAHFRLYFSQLQVYLTIQTFFFAAVVNLYLRILTFVSLTNLTFFNTVSLFLTIQILFSELQVFFFCSSSCKFLSLFWLWKMSNLWKKTCKCKKRNMNWDHFFLFFLDSINSWRNIHEYCPNDC